MTTLLTSVADALALYDSIPSIIASDGDATIKRRATTCEIIRIGDSSDFEALYAQHDETTLPSGKTVKEQVAPLRLKASKIAGDTVTINDIEIPIALAFAIINAAYIKYQMED